MTLAFTQQARGSMGEKAFRSYSVTLDGSITTIEASSLDLHYIDTALVTGVSMSGDIGPVLSTAAGPFIVLGTTYVTGDVINLWVWGF